MLSKLHRFQAKFLENWVLSAHEKLKNEAGFSNSLLHLFYISFMEGILFKHDKTAGLKWSHNINVRNLQSFFKIFLSTSENESGDALTEVRRIDPIQLHSKPAMGFANA